MIQKGHVTPTATSCHRLTKAERFCRKFGNFFHHNMTLCAECFIRNYVSIVQKHLLPNDKWNCKMLLVTPGNTEHVTMIKIFHHCIYVWCNILYFQFVQVKNWHCYTWQMMLFRIARRKDQSSIEISRACYQTVTSMLQSKFVISYKKRDYTM